jgi:hypothetical protein
MGHVQSGQALKQLAPATTAHVFIGGPWGSCLRYGFLTLPADTLAQADLLEVQADMLGLGYLVNAGYDPQSLVSVFEHWRGRFRPDEQVRAKALALSRFAGDTVLNTSAFDVIRSRLATRISPPRRPPTLNK